jgi:ketosteroid isomerase-like protein
MKIRDLAVVAGICLAAGTGLAFAQGAKVDRAAEEAALKALDRAWSEAANRKDLDATVAFMAEDGETLAPNEPLARTKEAIRASWNGLMQLPDAKISWAAERAQVAESGELGYTSGSYSLSFTGPDGKTVTDNGKYLEVWKKVDGKWKCLSDAYNSSVPLPQP